MSWGLHIAADAQADLRRFATGLQEDVLDELERLAAEPALIPSPLADWGIVHTFAQAEGEALHVVALYLVRDDRRELLTMTGARLAVVE